MGEIRLAINRQTQSLVSYLNCVTTLPALFQSNVQAFRIYVVDPDPSNVLGGFVQVDMGTSGLRMAIGDSPTGTIGGPTPLTFQNTFTWNAAGKYFTGSLNLNVAAVASFIGSAASKAAYFEINETVSADRITLFQSGVTLKAVVDEMSQSPDAPLDQYLTQAESVAAFLKFINVPGATVVFKSPNGVWGREIGVNDDGSAMDNIISL